MREQEKIAEKLEPLKKLKKSVQALTKTKQLHE